MSEQGTPGRVRYRFPPLERRGVVAGWRGGQIAAVAVGLALAAGVVRSRPNVVGVVVAATAVGASFAVAFWPVRGRTGEQWLPLAGRWAVTGRSGTRRRTAPGPRDGLRARVARSGADVGTVALDAAPRTTGAGRPVGRRTLFDGLELVPVPLEGVGGEAGMVVDGPGRTVTAVAALAGHSFALLGPAEQDARIAGWARVLSGLAREGTEVHRLQWIESCLADDGRAVRRHWQEQAVVGPESAAGRSYRALIDEAAPTTRRHRVLLALTVHTGRSARAIRSSGGGRAGAAAVLGRELGSLQRALEGADVVVEGVLGRAGLARAVAEAVAPSHLPPAPTVDPRPAWPWPMATEPTWDALHTDGTWHATYWVAEWPRVDVTPDFLGPLLFAPFRRSLALVMEPVSPARAARQVARARTADLADGELRRRGGFLTTARHHRERETVEHRDTELADGHAQFRFSGYLAVTADSPSELGAACAALEQAAGQSRLEVRRLYGEQDTAFTCLLPLGRGLT